MKSQNKSNNDTELQVIISTPQGTWVTSFPKTAKVSEVLNAIISHFGFASTGGNYTLNPEDDPDTELKPERPLVSYGIKDGATLVFTDLGVAV